MKRLCRAAVLFLLLCFSFRQAAVIRDHALAVSLRFSAPFAIDQAAPFAAVWSEEEGSVSGIGATVIRFAGDARLAFPAEWVCGAPPNDLMKNACAVSTNLAWALYGGTEVTALTLQIGEETHRLCGVFEHGSPVLLLPGEDGFTAAELYPVPTGTDLYRHARNCAAQAGLEDPAQILCGPEIGLLAGLLPWLCVISAAWPLLCRIARGRYWVWVLALPILLAVIPDWCIPTRWSDTVFWENWIHSLHSRFRDWLMLRPALRDLAVKEAWFGLMAGILCSWAMANKFAADFKKTDM